MRVRVYKIEHLMADNIFADGSLLTSFSIGMRAEATVEFESGNRLEAVFEFPEADTLSFVEAERLIRKELSAE
ncbi:hypothetical protein SFC27_00110 [Bacillus licheniformis]|uniref:hypothetical protein n=1 Tax=Bacillus TaxID=1386 RepID=UPI0003052106|nr:MULTISPECIES: hypothetical protein [Bacillus]AUZ30261.1 hypothetical protein C1T27_07870 [Bacillus licheniformis]MBG9695604.1 hypothetical protein [Bacillus licheniformis]MBU8800506.1 hypothetical protein [Bacillus licheniformis]MCC2134125.1 hypothetical protein [Bacillus licheniformis]MCC2146461.1 hypothetical protein [Bacillus licheniformis]